MTPRQEQLEAKGFNVEPDGKFGPETEAAVRAFQRRRSRPRRRRSPRRIEPASRAERRSPDARARERLRTPDGRVQEFRAPRTPARTAAPRHPTSPAMGGATSA